MSVQFRKSRAQDEARQARERQRAVTDATQRLEAYARGERAAVERRDVELVLEQLHAAKAAGGNRGEAKE